MDERSGATGRPGLVIVFGAGSAPAWAWHTGVVAAIESELGECAADHHLIGTSAGSAMAAGLRAGVEAPAIFDWMMQPPTAEERDEFRSATGNGRRGLHRIRPLAPGLLRSLTAGTKGLALAGSGLLPAGVFPTRTLGMFAGADNLDPADGWPEGLWVVGARVHDGERVVFGRDLVDVSVADALEASSAVPAMFRPKEIDGVEYIDGAAYSSTSADLAAELKPDLVIISAVQTRPGRRVSRIAARARLADEIETLEAAGIACVVVQPDAEMVPVMAGFPRKNRAAGPRIVETARQTAVAALAPHR